MYFLVYETKGLSLEEVDEMYADKTVTAWRSAGWRPRARSEEKGKGEVAESSSAEVVALEEAGPKRV